MAETAVKETPVEATVEDPEPVKVPKAAPVTMIRFGLESEYNQRWRVTVEQGVLPEQTLDQGFWANVSMHFNPGDEIIVMPDGMEWKQILQVIDKGKLFAHVQQLELYDLIPHGSIPALPSIYKIDFAGAHHKWRVVRAGQPLRDGFRTRSEAARWAANHEGAVNR